MSFDFPDISSWNLVVIDDEEDNLNLMEYLLDFLRIRCRAALSGKLGLDLIRVERPNLVLLDLQMSGLSGYDVLSLIRKDPELADLTVIALTAQAMPFDREKALSAGFDGYITKPISPPTFINDIVACLQEVRSMDADD